MNRSTPSLPVHYQLPELTQTHVHRDGDAIQPSHPLSPLLLLPSIFPSIRVFSNESVLRIRWPKCWSFCIGVSPSNEYSEFISFRIDWFDLLTVWGTLKSLLPPTVQKHQFFDAWLSLWSNSHIHTWLLEKPCFDCMDLSNLISIFNQLTLKYVHLLKRKTLEHCLKWETHIMERSENRMLFKSEVNLKAKDAKPEVWSLFAEKRHWLEIDRCERPVGTWPKLVLD